MKENVNNASKSSNKSTTPLRIVIEIYFVLYYEMDHFYRGFFTRVEMWMKRIEYECKCDVYLIKYNFIHKLLLMKLLKFCKSIK